MEHDCPKTGCLYCMVTGLYEKIKDLKDNNLRLAVELVHLRRVYGQKDQTDREERERRTEGD